MEHFLTQGTNTVVQRHQNNIFVHKVVPFIHGGRATHKSSARYEYNHRMTFRGIHVNLVVLMLQKYV